MSVSRNAGGSRPVDHGACDRHIELRGQNIHQQDIFDVFPEDAGLTFAAGDLEAELLVAVDGALAALVDVGFDAVEVDDVEAVAEEQASRVLPKPLRPSS